MCIIYPDIINVSERQADKIGPAFLYTCNRILIETAVNDLHVAAVSAQSVCNVCSSERVYGIGIPATIDTDYEDSWLHKPSCIEEQRDKNNLGMCKAITGF